MKNSVIEIPRVVEAKDLNGFVSSKVHSLNPEPKAFGDIPGRCLKLEIARPGLLESLQFIDDHTAQQPSAADEIELEVEATGVNFRDVLIALGLIASDNVGRDCAGIITQAGIDSNFNVGDRVVCIAPGAFQTRARPKAVMACPIPLDMPFTTAAALLAPFLTAYYALVEVGRIRPHETVLIHSAAGGTGQACIQLAQLYGAEIYATAGTDEKRELLRETYGIPNDHIFTSRLPAFASGIRTMTKGRGVDVVVNSLAGEAMRNTWEECLAPLGRFIEIGKKDISSFGQFPMSTFAKNVTFASVVLTMHCSETPAITGNLLTRIVDLLLDGKINVQEPLAVFNASQIEEAFHLMQSGRNRGKMAITFGDQDIVPVAWVQDGTSILPKYHFDANASYVIAGGLGGLGQSIARWMASHRARHLILLGSSNPIRKAGKVLVDELRAQGVSVATPPCDVSDSAALKHALNHCRETMPPIKGCIQGAMVLKDAAFANMSRENFDAVLGPFLESAFTTPDGYGFLVLLSSITGITGNYGQANYAAGNTYQDALAQYRVTHGQKAVSADLSNIRSVGYLAERHELATALRI
ncbi:MAG: hypothetical protein Q9181_006418 [Wetmoreana brouardii]